MNKIKPIVVVMGEPFSVFSEIFFKTFKAKFFKKFSKPVILVGSIKLITEQMNKLGFHHKINLIKKDLSKLEQLNNDKINIIDVNFNFKNPFDKITNKSNSYIKKSFEIAIELINKKKCCALINGPISKRHFLNSRFLGITEYLANKVNKNDKVAMLIYNKKLSVSPITTHLPLKDVPKNITKNKIKNHVKLINSFYKKRFNRKPIIAITGLNPHCESNYKTSEDENIINPAIKELQKKNYKVDGPFAADTIFMKEQSKKFDVIIGMYHDQVLTPIKTLFGFNAINITLGLPFIRISPDHGPNTSMLGKKLSNPQSLIEAFKYLDK